MVHGPQLENGYTRISNDFLEALARYRIPGVEMQCIFVVIRKTWGWQKKEDAIALSQIALATGISRPHICRALKSLESKQVIIAKKGNGIAKTYRINSNSEEWKTLPKKATLPERAISVAANGNPSLPKMGTTKERHTKKTISKDNFPSDSHEIRLSRLLFDQIRSNNPKAKEPNLQCWAKHIDLAIRRDNRTPEELEDVIRFAQSDSFWMCNIFSTLKLREKFDQLYLKMTQPRSTRAQRRIENNLKASQGAHSIIFGGDNE